MKSNFAYKAMPQTPRSFGELCMLIEDRCKLVLHFENKHDRMDKEQHFRMFLYESKLAQSHTGVPSSLLRSSSFNESDMNQMKIVMLVNFRKMKMWLLLLAK